MSKHYTKDITLIKKLIKDYVEIDNIFDIKIGEHLYYMTLIDDQEFFNKDGGYLENIGNESILLSNNCGYSWKVNTTKKDKYGNILYKSRIFIKDKIDDKYDNYNKKELISIINSQQMVIKKLTLELKNKV